MLQEAVIRHSGGLPPTQRCLSSSSFQSFPPELPASQRAAPDKTQIFQSGSPSTRSPRPLFPPKLLELEIPLKGIPVSGKPPQPATVPVVLNKLLLLLPSLTTCITRIIVLCFADDIQLYVSFRPDDSEKLMILLNCLTAIKDRMAHNFLQLNTDKTEALIVGTGRVASKVAQCIGFLSSAVQPKVRTLGVIFDQPMYFDNYIKQLSWSCFFHLRNTGKLKSVVSHHKLEGSFVLLSHPVWTILFSFHLLQ